MLAKLANLCYSQQPLPVPEGNGARRTSLLALQRAISPPPQSNRTTVAPAHANALRAHPHCFPQYIYMYTNREPMSSLVGVLQQYRSAD